MIGPFAVIEGAARIDDGCSIQAHAIIGAHVVMGKNNVIGYGAIIGADPQDASFKSITQSHVRIGEGNKIREYCTIHRGTMEGSATVIGDQNFLMAGTHVAHNARVGNNVVIANNVLLGGHAVIEDRVFIGGGCGVHQHVRIGRLAMCQGASGFSKDLPPFTIGMQINIVAGLNVIGTRRAGLDATQRAEIKEAFSLIYRGGLNTSQALAKARTRIWGDEASSFFKFIEQSGKRGFCAMAVRPRVVTEETFD